MDLRLPAEYNELRLLVRRFVAEQLVPYERQLDREDGLPAHVWAELEDKGRKLGLHALAVPTEHGGAGLDTMGQLVTSEEMGHVAVGFRHIIGTPAGAEIVARFGTDEQRERYLEPWLAGNRWGAWSATEPGAGSDLGRIATQAVRGSNGGWRISGQKHFVTGLDRADFVVVFTKTSPEHGSRGLTAFLLDVDTPRLVRGRAQPMMGRSGLHSFELYLDEVEVGDEQRLGEVDRGIELLLGDVSRMRLLMAGHCLGAAARLIGIASEWSHERVQFDRQIGSFEALQAYFARSLIELEMCRAATYHAAVAVDAGLEARAESAIAKAHSTEMAFRVADRMLQVMGGAGYSKDVPVESVLRALRLWRIAEGTSEVQRMLVGRELARGWRPGLFSWDAAEQKVAGE
jgi:alkylation response protein AidB-like acyl-CoA dehydrogenase